ncbi:RnfABCDGE type electron transport complex subunit D [Actibacterium ureilyticum]|uniref:RnfABCDGE type electron transport complex subunit D n=1 Tax=Actibacterium ureilyticum TaxID=1590614 RepID=UPI000BAAED4A|nr:RnfABCDGE type electron transport complex subunit D [Actibacterium ureilyticum]
MTAPLIISGPHTHSKFSVTETMIAVMLCLTPATALGFYMFGLPAILLFAVTIASALLFEALCLALAARPVGRALSDGSAILTGWILAMTLPPWAPWWIGTVGAFIAIVLGKHVYGGLGQNPFNPAMVARAMLLVALPVPMTMWVLPAPLLSPGAPDLGAALAITFGTPPADIDSVSAASTLGHVGAALDGGRTLDRILPETFDLHRLFFGNVPGSMGETSALLLLVGGVFLAAMRIIRLNIPLAVLGSAAALSGLLHLIDPGQFPSPLWHLSSGALMFCAFFIATDYVTSPVSGVGQLIYGAGIGLLVVVIRTWGSFPEGVAFAVLLMNACTPLIDTYTRPRIFGRDRRGRPLKIDEGDAP